MESGNPGGVGGEQQTESFSDSAGHQVCGRLPQKLWGGRHPLLTSTLTWKQTAVPRTLQVRTLSEHWMSLCQCPGCFGRREGQAAPPIPRPSIPTAWVEEIPPTLPCFLRKRNPPLLGKELTGKERLNYLLSFRVASSFLSINLYK